MDFCCFWIFRMSLIQLFCASPTALFIFIAGGGTRRFELAQLEDIQDILHEAVALWTRCAHRQLHHIREGHMIRIDLGGTIFR